MTTRTSKKQMHEVNDLFRMTFGAGTGLESMNMVYAAGELDASKNAYIIRDGATIKYKSNNEAYLAACEMIFEADNL